MCIRDRAEAWTQKHKGKAAKTPKEAAAGQEIVFSCVGDDNHLRAVMLGDDGALAGVSKGTILFDNTTASADIARELHAAAKKIGVDFIDAPVSGGQAGAENGQLTVCAVASRRRSTGRSRWPTPSPRR